MIFIATYTSGFGDPFAADTLDLIIEHLAEISGGRLVKSVTNGDGNTDIEWSDDCDNGFHIWVEKGDYLKSSATLRAEHKESAA